MNKPIQIALFGNPNSGKTTLFNLLTGLKQHTGNFPGVTVEQKSGRFQLDNGQNVHLLDFPGTYSLYPTAQDEQVVPAALCAPGKAKADLILYVADMMHLESHLLLFTQLRDFEFPAILILNMADAAADAGIQCDTDGLSKSLGVPVIKMNSRSGEGLSALKLAIIKSHEATVPEAFYTLNDKERAVSTAVSAIMDCKNPYQALQIAHHSNWLTFENKEKREAVLTVIVEHKFSLLPAQVEETMSRFRKITGLISKHISQDKKESNGVSTKLDNLLTHQIAGPLIFFGLLLMIFQAIFAWSELPMSWIETIIGTVGGFFRDILPESWATDLLVDGVISGIGGVLIFIPQISILFFLIAILEESGYLARAVFMFDKLMQRFGLNGRSLVALMSSSACAIPAVMATRTISNAKERLITILVTPLISCSARIPVYTVIIGLIVPAGSILGIFSYQAMAFMGLYLLGLAAALISAWVLKRLIADREAGYLLIDLPDYKVPLIRNILYTVYEKVRSFVWEAGRVILVISVILWFLASYGPGAEQSKAEALATTMASEKQLNEEETESLKASMRLEHSYAGIIGKTIEPVIKPLGYDWKIGIALLSSFAAREVFVGTMATIYSVGNTEDEFKIRERMATERWPGTDKPIYSLAASLSLLIFFAFAMQCMSTVAVVYRETKGWKWPLIQLCFMTLLAYFSALIVFQLFDSFA